MCQASLSFLLFCVFLSLFLYACGWILNFQRYATVMDSGCYLWYVKFIIFDTDDTSSPNFSSHRIISLTYLLHLLSRNATLFCLVSHLQTLLQSTNWREQYLLTAFGICAHWLLVLLYYLVWLMYISHDFCSEVTRRLDFRFYFIWFFLVWDKQWIRPSSGWAYGMNTFYLKEWKKKDITRIYHKWQNMVCLWKNFSWFSSS